MSFRIAIDSKDVIKAARDLRELSGRQAFKQRDKRSIGNAGAKLMVQPARQKAKRRPKGERTLVFSPRGRGPVFAHVPGNAANTMINLPLRRAYGGFLGARMDRSRPSGSYTTRTGKTVPLFGNNIRGSYAPYFYKAYGSKSGSDFGQQLLAPLIATHGAAAQRAMEKRALEVLTKKLRKVGY